jgi:ketosteroid isomerase-like protein
MSSPEANKEIVRAYYAAMGGEPGAALDFYSPDVIQDEFPNRFLPEGARRDLRQLGEAAERGRKVMSSQTFEIVNMFAEGDTVIVEADWSGTLAIPLGEQTPAGTVMRAHFAQVIQLADGKIVRQRNYDCFYPF